MNLKDILPDLKIFLNKKVQEELKVLEESGGCDEKAMMMCKVDTATAGRALSDLGLTDGSYDSRYDRSYGPGHTDWTGALSDGRNRGNVPYFCPSGWHRCSLKINEFDSRFQGWGYCYHGTNGENVSPILKTGFLTSSKCYCANGEKVVYMSPSISYCSHPRYATPFKCKGKDIQVVLQCRINPKCVWKKRKLTLEKRKIVDKNVSDNEMEWLFKADDEMEDGRPVITNAIICTGIMMRYKEDVDCDAWW